MGRLSLGGLCLAALVLATSACTVIVGGKLDKLPEGDDAGTARCTPMAMCDDGNPCTGPDRCSPEGNCVGTVSPDGAPCDADGNPATLEICVMAMCHLPRCGDRVVTMGGMFPEECDDGNTTNDDGCDDDCTFTCQNDSHCDDGDLCNGMEVCMLGLPGTRTCRGDLRPLPANGTPCIKPDANPGVCMGTICT